MMIEPSELRKCREKAGMSQDELARMSGVSQPAITKIETDRMKPSFELMKKITLAIERKEADAGKLKRVGDIMNQLITARPQDKISSTLKVMKEKGFSQLPVLDDRGRNVGTISESSILDFSETIPGQDKGSFLVRDAMGRELNVVNRETSVEAVKPLIKKHYAVLVSDGADIVGIVTMPDIL